MPDLRQLCATPATQRPERLPPAALAMGGALFAAAIGVPLAVLGLSSDVERAGASPAPLPVRTAAALVETPIQVARSGQPLDAPAPELMAGYFDGPVVPGQTAAGIALGTSLDETLSMLPPGSVVDKSAGTGTTTRSVDLDGVSVELTADADATVSRIALVARDCSALRYHQQRRIDATLAGGVALGSHISRVERQLGQPRHALPGGRAGGDGPVEQLYPGLGVSYCAESMLVRRLTVFTDPSIQLIAGTREPAAPQLAQFDRPLTRSGADTAPQRDEGVIAVAPPSEATGRLPEVVRAPRVPLAGQQAPRAPLTDQPGAALAGLTRDEWAGDDTPIRLGLPGALAEFTPPPAAVPGPGAEDVPEEKALSRQARRVAQIRLKLLGFDPRGADGIFGPRTRAAIEAFQSDMSLPGTGLLDEATYAALSDRSEPDYRRWQRQVRERARAARQAARDADAYRAALSGSIPPRPRAAPECARDSAGNIIENQSFSCDWSVLREGLRDLFGNPG